MGGLAVSWDRASFLAGLAAGRILWTPPRAYGRGWTADPAFLIREAGAFCTNSGSRTPHTKVNDGLAICCTVTNANAGEWGGGWTWPYLISTELDAVRARCPGQSFGYVEYEYAGLHWYCGCAAAYNQNWGGATDVVSDWPVFDWEGAQGGIVNGIGMTRETFLRIMQLAGVRRS